MFPFILGGYDALDTMEAREHDSAVEQDRRR